MTETKVENVERWLHFQSVKRNENKTIAKIVPIMMISWNHYIYLCKYDRQKPIINRYLFSVVSYQVGNNNSINYIINNS